MGVVSHRNTTSVAPVAAYASALAGGKALNGNQVDLMQPTIGAASPHRSTEERPAPRTVVLRVAAGCALATLAVASCSSGTGSAADAGTTPPPDTAPGDEDAAVAAYTAMWTETAEAASEGGGTNGDLDKYATGAALALLNEALAGAEGTEVAGEPVLDPEVEMEADNDATVTDCLDDSGWTLDPGTSTQGGPRKVEAGLVHDGLAWRVSELRIWESGSC